MSSRNVLLDGEIMDIPEEQNNECAGIADNLLSKSDDVSIMLACWLFARLSIKELTRSAFNPRIVERLLSLSGTSKLFIVHKVAHTGLLAAWFMQLTTL